MQTPAQILHQVKAAIREPYAWPGGYPVAILMADGDCLCPGCARENFRAIVGSTLRRNLERDGWEAAGSEINWEDADMTCAHCGDLIPSAYGEE